MGLSLDKFKEIDLEKNSALFSSGETQEIDINTLWPSLAFLQGMGFSKIEFNSPSKESLALWIHRIESYEQSFLEDPDYIDVEACVWDELSEDGDSKVIHCQLKLKNQSGLSASNPSYHVPKLAAPLRIDPRAAEAFVNEVRNQKSEDIILRTHSIIKEFREAKKSADQDSLSRLVTDIICISLENHHLNKAVDIYESNRELLKNIWGDDERAIRLIASYELSPHEFARWYSLFETLSNDRLVSLMKNSLGTAAGPKILQLMNQRAKESTTELIEICLNQGFDVQKLLMQWLAPLFQIQHYSMATQGLKTALENNADIGLINSWLMALLHSYQTQAFSDLSSYFKPKSLWSQILRPKPKISYEMQRNIIQAIGESPSKETLQFLKQIKPFTKGGLADQVDKLISNYKGRLVS